VRAPLSAGAIALFALWLAFEPLSVHAAGVQASLDDLKRTVGPVTTTSVIAFAG
jgi:hypothetical protein